MDAEAAIFETVDRDAESAADAEAEADIAAGRVTLHADVAAWLATWGTPNEAPPPASWFK